MYAQTSSNALRHRSALFVMALLPTTRAPRELIKALKRVLSQDDIRFFGNVDYGTDLKLDDLQQFL